MRKLLLITTCGAALSALVAIGASQPSLAQQTDQQKHEASDSEPATKAAAQTQKGDTSAKPDTMNNEKRAADKTEQREKAKTGQADSKEAKPESQTGDNQEKPKSEMRSKETAQDHKDSTHTRNAANREHRLDERQAADLRQRLQKEGRVAETTVNFEVRIGVNVPETVKLRELPTEVIVEYPQFRGYDFVMVEDQIVIVDPQSRGVVEVVGGPPTTRAAAVNPCSTTQ